MYNILRIVILVVSYYVLRCMYCILCYLITKLTCSIEEPLCGNAIKSLLLLLLLLYGDPREVVDAHLHRITNWHNIKEKDRDAFERFADALQAAVFALDKPDYRHELSSMPLCTQLVRKLPPSEKDEWVRQVIIIITVFIHTQEHPSVSLHYKNI